MSEDEYKEIQMWLFNEIWSDDNPDETTKSVLIRAQEKFGEDTMREFERRLRNEQEEK